LCWSISEFKNGCQPKTDYVKDEKNDLFSNTHCILSEWKNYFSQLLYIRVVNNVMQTEIHIFEHLVSELSACEVTMAI